ncbi:MAG: cytochrome c3 family protein [Nitrospiraceae bacterium]|nr:cytochrome c3 family protein [Nitrospiraceae bacterium]
MAGKIRILLVMAVMVVVLFGAVSVRKASALVTGSRHDLSLSGASNFQYDTQEPCIFCHTPHGANMTQSYSTNPATVGAAGTLNGTLLWNRAVPVRAWQVYTSPTMDSNNTLGPGPLSLLCLSCHDGVGAMNVLIKNPSDSNGGAGGKPTEMPGVTKNQFGDFALGDPNYRLNVGDAVCDGGLGTACSSGADLRNDHPIGFVYNPAVDLQGGLNVISNPVVQARMTLTGNRVECSSCHDPHLTNNAFPTGNNFLVMSNAGSALCLVCHNK